MGDIILQTPWISWIKRFFPEIKLSFITLDVFKDLVEEHPHIDKVLFIKRRKGISDIRQLHKLSKDLASIHKVDLIIDLHGTLRSQLIRFFTFSIPSLKLYKRSLLRWILVKFKWDFLKDLNSHHFRVIEDFSFLFSKKAEIEKLKIFLKEQVQTKSIGLTSLPSSYKATKASIDDEYIVISPVASFASKRWPLENVTEFINQFLAIEKYTSFKIIIIAGPDDDYCGNEFSDPLNNSGRIINKQGQTTLIESIEYIKHSILCLTNDTGAAHIAEALGVPSISLFGATSESFGFRMHLDKSINLSHHMSCRPCSQTGKRPCFQKSHLCMEKITGDFVLKKLSTIVDEINNEKQNLILKDKS